MDDPESRRFPFFDDMRAEGVTGYIALPLRFIDGTVHASSWSTKQPGGFTDAQLAALRTLIVPFARLGEIFALRRTATTCSKPMSDIAPASASWPDRSGAAIPRR